jgi:hypothetical protein
MLANGGGLGLRRHGHDVGQCEVDRAARGWDRQHGVNAGRTGFGWSVGPLGPGDGSLVHHPR